MKTIEEKRAELAAKRAANEAREKTASDASASLALDQEIAIEDKRAEAYASGLVEAQLVEAEFPGVGKSLFRTPQDLVYRLWAKKSGAIKGELVSDITVHEEFVAKCILYPTWAEFSAAYRERCPNAPVQMASVLNARMSGTIDKEKK